MSAEEQRFLADLARRPLSTTVSRYQRLHLSRRRGNAVRQHLTSSGVIEAVAIATRSGQVVLYQLTDHGRAVCRDQGIDPGPVPRTSLEHAYWARRAGLYFEKKGYEIRHEHAVEDNGVIDLLAERAGRRLAVEIETGKSDIRGNIQKLRHAGFERLVMIATSPTAVTACRKAIDGRERGEPPAVELLTWLDLD